MDKTKIHLVKASFHAQFRKAMESCGASADNYFNKVKLPLVVSDPESLLPEKPFFTLINMFAISEDIPNFGSIVAQTTPWHKVVSLAPLIENSYNLRDLLERFCPVSTSQSSLVSFSFNQGKPDSRFCYTNDLSYQGDVQMEFYRMTSMIQLVQLATGAQWRPKTINLLMSETPLVKTCPLLNSSNIVFSQQTSSISIESNLLQLPVHMEIPTGEFAHTELHAASHVDFIDSLRQIIDTYVQSGGLTIEDLAHINDQSVRTIQRRLKSAGVNFNTLLNESRFEHARDRLSNSDFSVSEIARLLGYSDPAHFTRAFRRWAGVTPNSYRKSRQSVKHSPETEQDNNNTALLTTGFGNPRASD